MIIPPFNKALLFICACPYTMGDLMANNMIAKLHV